MSDDILDKYLEDIDDYLHVRVDGSEILAEIRSHILEKAESKYGNVDTQAVSRVIAAYGSPRAVAARYSEGLPIIDPIYTKSLIRYTGALFGLHLILILAASIFRSHIWVFPFFRIPAVPLFELPLVSLTAFIYDLGLVGIFFAVLTRKNPDIPLPWPSFRKKAKTAGEKNLPPRVLPLVLMTTGWCALVYVFLRFGTLFFRSFDPVKPQPLFTPRASQWYSLALLTLLAVGIAGSAARLRWSGAGPGVVKNILQLVVYGVILSLPFEKTFPEDLPIALELAGAALVVLLALGTLFELLKNLVVFSGEQWRKRRVQESR